LPARRGGRGPTPGANGSRPALVFAAVLSTVVSVVTLTVLLAVLTKGP
jgi:hypothetical protein